MINIGKGLAFPELTFDLADYLNLLGKVWRATIYPQLLPAAGNYCFMSFKTPPSGACIYQLATFSKTGDEVQGELFVGTTVTGGSPMSLVPLNHNFLTVTPPFLDPIFGLSAAGASISGGTILPGAFIPGTSTGVSQAGGTLQGGSLVYLKNDTVYALKMTAIGNNTKIAAFFNISHVQPNP